MARYSRSAGRTETGKVRRRNEDSILVRRLAGLWAIADGLGGHAAGDYASQMVVAGLAALARRGNVLDFIESIEDALGEVNAALQRTALAWSVDLIASTVVLLVEARNGLLLCGWVGDSRAYRCARGQAALLTRDHVYGSEVGGVLPAAGTGVLTHAVGADAKPAIDWVAAAGGPGATFVLCSDGLNKELTDAEIAAACCRRKTPQAVLDDLFDTALARRARDNISAVVVQPEVGRPALRDLDDVNRHLRVLDAAHRRGSVDSAGYRAERRALLAALLAAARPTRR